MSTLLEVTRRRFQGPPETVELVQLHDGRFATQFGTGRDRIAVAMDGATTALGAIARARVLNQADIRDHTAFEIPAESSLTEGDLMAAIRTRGNDDPRLEDDPDTDHVFGEVDFLWSTRHHITVNRSPVFSVPRTPHVVRAHDYRRPYRSWPDLITLDWDSSGYAGVGNAGFGTSGAYRPRPDLLALVVDTDESLEIAFRRASASVSAPRLVQRALASGIFPDDIYARLLLTSHGYDASDLEPSDVVTTSLTQADLYRLVNRALGNPTRASTP